MRNAIVFYCTLVLGTDGHICIMGVIIPPDYQIQAIDARNGIIRTAVEQIAVAQIDLFVILNIKQIRRIDTGDTAAISGFFFRTLLR